MLNRVRAVIGGIQMTNESAALFKIRRAANARFYAVWRGQPVCTPSGGLRYFDTEDQARAALAEREHDQVDLRDIAA
jgi:hypothetical protein